MNAQVHKTSRQHRRNAMSHLVFRCGSGGGTDLTAGVADFAAPGDDTGRGITGAGEGARVNDAFMPIALRRGSDTTAAAAVLQSGEKEEKKKKIRKTAAEEEDEEREKKSSSKPSMD